MIARSFETGECGVRPRANVTVRRIMLAATIVVASALSTDAAADEETFARNCGGCHTIGAGAQHGVGPALTTVYGRRAGSLAGYRYSDELAKAGRNGLIWNTETLDGFLADPRGYLWGNRMAYAGLSDADARRAIIRFLRDVARGRADAVGEGDGGR